MTPQPTQYIEICSARRNRKIWPLISDFDVEITFGMRDKRTAFDPVCRSAPEIYWNANFSYDTSISNSVVIENGLGSQTEGKIVLISSTDANYLRPELNFYDGCVLVIETASMTYKRRIVYYRLISNGTPRQAVIRLDTSLPENITITDSFIDNSAITNTTTVSTSPQIFIPSGEDVENYYIKSILQNINTYESVSLRHYDEFTHLSLLTNNTLTDWNNNNNQNFALRDELPAKTGYCVATNAYTIYVIDSNFSLISDNDYYCGDFLRLLPETLPTNGVAMIAPYGNMVRIKENLFLNFTVNSSASVGTNQFVLNEDVNADIVGMIMYIPTLTPSSYTIVSVISGVITTVEMVASGTVSANSEARIRQFKLFEALTATPSIRFRYEFLLFSYDNFAPLSYRQTAVFDQSVCYELQLLNIILPNIPIITGKGGLIGMYPYIYVELTCKSQILHGAIFSNNPVSNKMLFRVVISDTNAPDKARFIKLNGSGMAQTVKFKPNDTLHFSVKLPNGELFDVETPEHFSPNAPNSLRQISAIFSLRRIV